MISNRSAGLLIDTVVCLTLAKWETVSGRFGGYLTVKQQTPHARSRPSDRFRHIAGAGVLAAGRAIDQKNGRRAPFLVKAFPRIRSASSRICSAPTDTRLSACNGELTSLTRKALRKPQSLRRERSKRSTDVPGSSMRIR